MPLTYTQYVGDGTTANFAVPFLYLDKSHVKVSVDGVAPTFTWVNDALIQISPAPAQGTIVQVYRVTPREIPMVDFQDASTLVEDNLDLAAKQGLYVASEALDKSDTVFGRSYKMDELDSLFNGTTKTFQLKYLGQSISSLVQVSGLWFVYLNGLNQEIGSAYTVDSLGFITFADAPAAGTNASIRYLRFYGAVGNGSTGGGSGPTIPGGGESGGTPPPDGTEYPPVVVGPVEPAEPACGQVWFDTASKLIKIFECTLDGDPSTGSWVEYEWTPTIPPTNISIGTAPPENPVEGSVWFDTVNNVIQIYENGVWVAYEWKPEVPASGISVGATLPADPQPGYVHFNSANNQIYYYNGTDWVAYAWGISGVASVQTVVNPGDLPSNATTGQVAYVTSEDKLYLKTTGAWTSNFGTAQLGPNSVTADMIAANAVVASKIAANAITAVKIAADAVSADKILAGAVSAIKIAAGAITADKISAGAITADKIGANVITGDKIVAASIGALQLAANAVTADKIAAGAITANKIAASTITGDKLAISSISADRIQTNTLILGTTNIQPAAISQVQWVRGGMTPLYTKFSYNPVLSLAMQATSGATRIIKIAYSHADDNNGSINTGANAGLFGSQVRLLIDGSEVANSDITVPSQSTASNVLFYVDTANRSGSIQVSAEFRWFDSTGTSKVTTIRNPTMIVEELKR